MLTRHYQEQSRLGRQVHDTKVIADDLPANRRAGRCQGGHVTGNGAAESQDTPASHGASRGQGGHAKNDGAADGQAPCDL